MNLNTLERPVFLVDKTKVLPNAERMTQKAPVSGVSLRPHFKTHQSATIGTWFAISCELLYDWRNPTGAGTAKLFVEHVPSYAEIFYSHQAPRATNRTTAFAIN